MEKYTYTLCIKHGFQQHGRETVTCEDRTWKCEKAQSIIESIFGIWQKKNKRSEEK